MSKKEEPKLVKLFGISKEDVGGWAQASSLSEYEITHEAFLKHCKRISKSEPDVFETLLRELRKKAREVLGI